MKVLWIGGWGTSPAWGLTAVRRWRPSWTHEWVTPSPRCAEWADGSHDWVGGYSLGACLILRRPEEFPAKREQFFVAPFLDLKREAGLGGLVATTQLKVTRKWLRRDPMAALNDFYQRAGLNLTLSDALPYAAEDLAWGLDILLSEPPPFPQSDPGLAVIGANDPLVVADRIKGFFPRNMVVEGAGHHLDELRGSLKLQ